MSDKKNTTRKTETVAITLPKGLKQKAKDAAAKDGRSLSNYITQLLKKTLDNE